MRLCFAATTAVQIETNNATQETAAEEMAATPLASIVLSQVNICFAPKASVSVAAPIVASFPTKRNGRIEGPSAAPSASWTASAQRSWSCAIMLPQR